MEDFDRRGALRYHSTFHWSSIFWNAAFTFLAANAYERVLSPALARTPAISNSLPADILVDDDSLATIGSDSVFCERSAGSGDDNRAVEAWRPRLPVTALSCTTTVYDPGFASLDCLRPGYSCARNPITRGLARHASARCVDESLGFPSISHLCHSLDRSSRPMDPRTSFGSGYGAGFVFSVAAIILCNAGHHRAELSDRRAARNLAGIAEQKR